MSLKYDINSRDLLNILRHAYLFGYNQGLSDRKTGLYLEFPERDEDLQSLIEDWKAQGYESYNEDLGSLEE